MDIATDQSKAKAARKPRAMSHSDEASEMQNVVNLPVTVKAFGRDYLIKRFNIFQLAQAMTYLGPLQYVVQELADKKESLTSGQVASVVLGALSISGESVIGLLSVATSEPADWIGAQDDEIAALELLTAVVEKNTHFFSPENLAKYKEVFGRLQTAIPALSGLTSTP